MIKFVLFDLDGTLLPMDQDIFVKAYFKELAKKLAPFGYDAQELISAVWKGMGKMLANNGTKTNEEVFWESFRSVLGEKVLDDRPVFDEFYDNEFNNVQRVCGFSEEASETVGLVRKLGAVPVVATLPVFPAAAIEARIRWAGVDRKTLGYCTTYENCRFSKPSLGYYREILDDLGAAADECIMVGNSVSEDMTASKLGIKVFLLTDCLINEHNEDISAYPRGSWKELQEFIKAAL